MGFRSAPRQKVFKSVEDYRRYQLLSKPKVDKRRILKSYEIEDIAHEMVKSVERKVLQQRKVDRGGSWSLVGTIRYGTNKFNFLRDEDMRMHMVVSGGKHNVNFNFEDEHELVKFSIKISLLFGLSVRNRGCMYQVHLGSGRKKYKGRGRKPFYARTLEEAMRFLEDNEDKYVQLKPDSAYS